MNLQIFSSLSSPSVYVMNGGTHSFVCLYFQLSLLYPITLTTDLSSHVPHHGINAYLRFVRSLVLSPESSSPKSCLWFIKKELIALISMSRRYTPIIQLKPSCILQYQVFGGVSPPFLAVDTKGRTMN